MNTKHFLSLLTLGGFTLVFLGLSFVKNGLKERDIGKRPLLRFRPNHEFIILQVTDLHLGEGEYRDYRTEAIHEYLIAKVKPDLVVNTGDAVSGWLWDKQEKNWYKKHWERFTNTYRKLKVPYAYTLGNHDREADATLDDIGELERSHEYSVFDGNRDIDPTSISNFITHIYSSFEGAYDKIAALVWLFDSKKTCQGVHDGNGCINKAQLDWYEKMSEKHADRDHNNKKVQGMAFFHVPIQEFMNVWNYEKTFGIKGEDVCCPAFNTGVFARFKKVGNIRVVGCGHDHNSNYGGTLDGIDLIYGQKTGYGAYGPEKFQRGGTIYKIKESMSSSGEITWTYQSSSIFEDGSIKDHQNRQWQGYQQFQDKCPT